MAADKSSIVQAVAVMIHTDRGMWLARRRDDVTVLPGRWETPCGKVERRESLRQAACREVREETGLVVRSENLILCGQLRCRGTRPGMMADVTLYRVRVEDVPQTTEPNKRDPWILATSPEEWAREMAPSALALLGVWKAGLR